MNTLDKQYTDLLQDILDNGVEKKDRTTTGTISVFGRQIRHKMSDGFPLLTTKKMAWKTMVTELLWFLRGDTNIKYLVDNGCNIWNGDAYKEYREGRIHDEHAYTIEEFVEQIKTNEEFAFRYGELGSIYGKQWRSWGDGGYSEWINSDGSGGHRTFFADTVDQIQNLINDLKTNPDSRRLMVSAWNVGELDQMVLPPCHYGFQVYTRELSLVERGEIFRNAYPEKTIDDFPEGKMDVKELKNIFNEANIPTRAISLMWNQRSVDTFLGLPFNIASYGLLLEIIAKAVNMVPDELIGNLGDVHLYSDHVEQAKEQIGRELTVEERVKLYEVKTNADTSFFPILSETLDFHNIPKRTREPYPLPTLKINSGNENWHLLTVDEIINSLDVDITFKVDGYQSHPSIKAPLSN